MASAVRSFAVQRLILVVSCSVLALLLCLPSANAEEKKAVLFFGDSLTAGYGLDAEKAYPALVEKALGAEGLPIRAINAGVSGDTSAGGLSRLAWVMRGPVDVFVLALGANDGLRGVPPEATKANLREIIKRVQEQSPTTKIVLVGIDIPSNLGPEFRARFKSIFPEIAQEFPVTFLPFLLEGVAGNRALNLPDGIHPNEAGQKIVAQNVLPVIRQLMQGSH